MLGLSAELLPNEAYKNNFDYLLTEELKSTVFCLVLKASISAKVRTTTSIKR